MSLHKCCWHTCAVSTHKPAVHLFQLSFYDCQDRPFMVQKGGDWSVLCWTGDLSGVCRCLSPPTGNPESSRRTVARNSGSWQKMDGFHSDYSQQIKRLMEHDLADTALPSSYLSFSADTYFKCPDTWGITPIQTLPDKFSALTTSISDSAPQIGTRPLRKRPHLWGHISIQPKKKPSPISHSVFLS